MEERGERTRDVLMFLLVFVFGAILIAGIARIEFDAAQQQEVVAAEEAEPIEIVCKVISVDTTQHTERRSSTSTGVVLADGKPIVATGVVPAGEATVTDYYVTLEDENGMVVQFTIQGDTYTALSKKIGETITLTYVNSNFLGMDNSYHSWQGKKLSDPIVIQEGE